MVGPCRAPPPPTTASRGPTPPPASSRPRLPACGGSRRRSRDGGARVVEVRGVGTDHIELDRLRPARPTAEAAEALGRGLAVDPRRGRRRPSGPPRPAGPVTPGSAASRRPTSRRPVVGPVLRGAAGAPVRAPGARPRSPRRAPARRTVDRVCDRLTAGDFDDDRPPARIHGDLWSGNVVVHRRRRRPHRPGRARRARAHRPRDAGPLRLPGPRPRSRPPTRRPPGSTRTGASSSALHQLHPLAVHAASHGPAYAAQLVEAARAFA